MVAIYNFTGYLHTLIFLNEKIVSFFHFGRNKANKKPQLVESSARRVEWGVGNWVFLCILHQSEKQNVAFVRVLFCLCWLLGV